MIPITEIPVNQDIIVDVVKSNLEVAYANQYDDNASTIHCHIQNKGVDFNIENYTITLRVKKSNGKGFSANIGSEELEGTVSGNIVSFKIPRYLTFSHGKQICNLEFFDSDHVDNGIKYSCTFYLRVYESSLKDEDMLDSDCYVSIHDEYIKLKTELTKHTMDTNNPHTVTKEQLGISDMETEIAELKKSVSDGKSAVASAITGMGVSTAADATFETMAGNVGKNTPTVTVNGSVGGGWDGSTFHYGGGASATAYINGKNRKQNSTSFTQQTTTVGGNALASDVLSGKKFSSNNAGREVNGTMTNRGAYTYDMWTKHTSSGVDQNLKVTIPAGYHNGSGYVRFPENVQTHALRMHTFGGSNNYTYLTIAPENGYYYSFTASVNGITATQCVFIVCYNSHDCNSVLDIIPVLKSDGVTKYTSQSGDYRAWGNRNQYHIEKIASNKYASGQWMGVQILTMVAQA